MSGYIMNLRAIVGHRPLLQAGASVIVEDAAGRILLQKRTDDHTWGYAGGSVELDEDVKEAAGRELLEETGLTARTLTLFGVYSGRRMHHVYPNGDEVSNVDVVFICKDYTGTLTCQVGEVEELRFFAHDEIPDDLFLPNSYAIREWQASKQSRTDGDEKETAAMSVYTVNGRTYELLSASEPYFLGRWFDKTIDGIPHKVTTTDGAQVYFLIEGAASFEVCFTVITRIRMPYFAYSIDGGEPVRQHIDEPTVRLPDAGKHTVCLVADGLTEGEGKWYEEIGFALRSITPAAGGRLWGVRPTAPIVFFYGDSITEGVRALNMQADSDGNSATHAYPWYCAAALGATPYFIGYGASGIVRVGWFNTMQRAIDGLSRQHSVDESPAAAQRPALIVINHGANDGALLEKEVEVALRETLARLQGKYPGVPVVYVTPLLQVQLNPIRTLMADYPNGHVVESAGWPVTFTDGLHPDAAGAKLMGEKIAEAIKTLGLLPES